MGKSGTGFGLVAVTPSNTVDVAKDAAGNLPRAVRFGTGGSCVIVAPDGSTATFTNIADGDTIDVDFKRINSTGLIGCADIVGIY